MNPDGSAQVHGTTPVAALPGMPALEVGMATDPGRDPNKQVNEDAMMARDTPHGHLAVVCDGMGGHVGGREASHLAVDTIFRHFDATPPGTPPQQVLGDALRMANAAVYARGQQLPDLKGMGSTCVALLTHPHGSEVAHVGDSRVYLITQGQAYQVTKDHSLVQRLVDANMLTPEQAANHPNANQITNAFGQRPDIDVEVRPQPFPHGAGDTFILCSDGLSDEVGPQDFLQVLAPHPPLDHACRQLVDLANARGGHDNITVVMVRLAGGAPFAVQNRQQTEGGLPVLGSVTTTTAEMEVLRPETITQAAVAAAATPPMPPSSHGAPQFQPPPPYVPTPIELPPKKSGKGLVIAVVIVLLLVVAGVAAAVVFRHKLMPSSDKEPSSAASTEASEEPSASASSGAKKELKPAPKPEGEASESPPPEPEPSANPRPSATASGAPPAKTTKPIGKPKPPPEFTK